MSPLHSLSIQYIYKYLNGVNGLLLERFDIVLLTFLLIPLILSLINNQLIIYNILMYYMYMYTNILSLLLSYI